jgi:hypothetical protein
MKDLIKYGRINIIKRTNFIKEFLESNIKKNPPMLFGALDYSSDSKIYDLNKAGNIDLEKLFEIFDNDDLKYGRKLRGYSSYIMDIDNMFNGIKTTHLPQNLFKQEMHSFLKSFNIDKNINFLTRTDVYNYMEIYRGEDPVKTVVYKQATKFISDFVCILNKPLFLAWMRIFILCLNMNSSI